MLHWLIVTCWIIPVLQESIPLGHCTALLICHWILLASTLLSNFTSVFLSNIVYGFSCSISSYVLYQSNDGLFFGKDWEELMSSLLQVMELIEFIIEFIWSWDFLFWVIFDYWFWLLITDYWFWLPIFDYWFWLLIFDCTY